MIDLNELLTDDNTGNKDYIKCIGKYNMIKLTDKMSDLQLKDFLRKITTSHIYDHMIKNDDIESLFGGDSDVERKILNGSTISVEIKAGYGCNINWSNTGIFYKSDDRATGIKIMSNCVISDFIEEIFG